MPPLDPDQVADHVELQELLSRYGTVVDRRDWEGFDTIFTDDVVFDLTDISVGTFAGLAQLKHYMANDARHPASHLITNIHVEVINGDRGRTHSRLLAVQDDGTVIVGGYQDEVVRTGDGWRIRHRIFTYKRRGK